MSQIVRLQILRATTAQRTSYTPAAGELLLDTDTDILYIGDGTTAGGLLVTSLGGSGETNTISNVGTGGVGLFKQKVGVDLELRNISAASSKVTVILDGGNDEVTIDIAPGQINTSELNNDANFITSSGAPVQSVNGQTGTVVLDQSDVGLGNVDNTSDLNKPISTATQAALNLKYDASNPAGYVDAAGAAAAAPVQSVSGKTGTVTLELDDLTDANTSTVAPQVGWQLKWDGSNWVPTLLATLENTTPQTNNTTTPLSYLQGNITLPRAGNYLVRTTYRWSLDATDQDFEGTFEIGGVNQVEAEHVQEPQDSGGTGPFATNQRYGFTAEWIYTASSAGSISFEQFHAGSAAGDDAAIYNCTIVVEELLT